MTLTHTAIISTTASYFGVTSSQLLARDQHQPLAHYRKIAMYLCRELLYASYPTIGRWFDRDHTTIIAAVRSIEQSVARTGGADTRHHIKQINHRLLDVPVDKHALMVSVGDGIVLA